VITTNTYLHFNGNCEEAFKFYAATLGGKIVMQMKGKDAPPSAGWTPEFEEKIMHARMNIGDSVLMGGDCPPNYYAMPAGFSVSINIDSPAEADRIYAILAKGGQEKMPIAETFWAQRFGMCIDRFGTPWMVNCEKQA
jgi:PhnB protein